MSDLDVLSMVDTRISGKLVTQEGSVDIYLGFPEAGEEGGAAVPNGL